MWLNPGDFRPMTALALEDPLLVNISSQAQAHNQKQQFILKQQPQKIAKIKAERPTLKHFLLCNAEELNGTLGLV